MRKNFLKLTILLAVFMLFSSIKANTEINDVKADRNKIANDGKIIENEILKYKEEKRIKENSEVIEQEIIKTRKKYKENLKNLGKETHSNYEINGVEPVGKSKRVYVYLYIPFGAAVQEKYVYNDEYYSGWIPILSKEERNLDEDKFWKIVYSGEVFYKGK